MRETQGVRQPCGVRDAKEAPRPPARGSLPDDLDGKAEERRRLLEGTMERIGWTGCASDYED